MIFREAKIDDIKGMQIVRNSVLENKLSDPGIISDSDYIPFIDEIGKGWVCIQDQEIVGFAFVDFINQNIWALFVKPEFEKRGIGKALHNTMLSWYFSNYKESLWLSTAPGTRAELFYMKQGWVNTGIYGKGEIKFEMTRQSWESKKVNTTNNPSS